MKLLILNESSRQVPKLFLRAWARHLKNFLLQKKIIDRTLAGQELTLMFLDEPAARQLNKDYRSKDYATDVLSFDSVDPQSLGELVLCPQVLHQQAQDHGMSYEHELGYMVLHGVLHLLGYDHEQTKKEARIMFALQDELFDQLLKAVAPSTRGRSRPSLEKTTRKSKSQKK